MSILASLLISSTFSTLDSTSQCCFFFCGCWRSLKFGLTRKVTANDARWRPHESNSVSVFFWECFCTISHFDHRRWWLLILKQLDVATCGLWFWFMTPHDFWVVTVWPSCRISESRIMSLLLASWMYGRLLRLLTEVIFFMKQLKPPASLVSEFLDFQQFYIKLGAVCLYVYLIDHKQTVWFSQGMDLVIYHIPFPPWRTQPRGAPRCKRCHLLRCFGEKGGDTYKNWRRWWDL